MLACFVVLCVLGLALAATPTRPQISDVFFAKVSVGLRQGTQYWRGGGLYAFDVPHGKARTDLRLDGPSGTIYQHILDRYDLNATYIISEDKCLKTQVSGVLPNPWAWVASANFTGTSSYGGRSLDDWELTSSKDTMRVSVLSENPATPVAFSIKSTNGTVITEWDWIFLEFNASTPEDWVFYIPENCGGKQILKGSPSSVVYFANSQWDCADPSCSSRVPVGSGQPGYECAEFVARSLAYGGYIPGLSSGAPQGDYGNYKGHNLLLTTGLASCLADVLGFKKLPNSGGSVNAAVAIFGDAGDGDFSHTCIGIANDRVDCHNNARQDYTATSIMYKGIDAVYGP